MPQGKFIAVEGADGAGKSTQIRLLREVFPDAVFTREPGGTPYGEQIRALIFEGDTASAEAMFFLFWAARVEHLDKLILPALAEGKMVVADRFDLSTYAYQLRGQFQTKGLDNLFWMIRQQLVIPKVGVSNLHYIYLDMDIAESMKRLEKRDGEVTHFDTRAIDFHERVRSGGHEFIESINSTLDPSENVCHIIDAGFTPEIVHRDVVAVVQNILLRG